MTLPECPVCSGPPGGRVVGLTDLTRAERHALEAWYAQTCADCGLARGIHQIYRHPHNAVSYGRRCVAFRLAPDCRCGCPPHPGRLCLETLDCLCTGYQPVEEESR
jgi:hypothetical protein